MEWKIIHLETTEAYLSKELANPNITTEDKNLLLKALKGINKTILNCEQSLADNKREAELIGVLINKSNSAKEQRIKEPDDFKMPFNQADKFNSCSFPLYN